MYKEKENPEIVSSLFGDGQQVESEQQVAIPATVGGTKCTIETDVVESKLPLRLSNNNSLKKAQTVLDVNSDTAKMFSQPVKLFQTSSDHYFANLLNNDRESHFRQTRFQEPKMWTHHFKHSCTLIRRPINQKSLR